MAQKKYRYATIAVHSLFVPDNFIHFEELCPWGFVTPEKDWNKKITLFVRVLRRGKNVLLPLTFTNLPANWNGTGSVALEGIFPNNIALLTSPSSKWVVQGNVGEDIVSYEELESQPFSKKTSFGSVLKNENTSKIFVAGEDLWAVWSNPIKMVGI